MTLPPPSPADDAAIDRLLRDFFAREMPRELRSGLELPAPSRLAAPTAAPRIRARRRTLVGSVVALTACGLIAVAASGRWGESAKRSELSDVRVAGPKGVARGPEGHANTRSESDRSPSVRGHALRDLGPATRADSVGGTGSADLDAGPRFVVEAASPAGDGTVPASVQPGGMAGGAAASVRLLDPHTGEPVEFVVPEEIPSGPNPFGRGGAGASQSPPDVRLPEERSR